MRQHEAMPHRIAGLPATRWFERNPPSTPASTAWSENRRGWTPVSEAIGPSMPAMHAQTRRAIRATHILTLQVVTATVPRPTRRCLMMRTAAYRATPRLPRQLAGRRLRARSRKPSTTSTSKATQATGCYEATHTSTPKPTPSSVSDRTSRVLSNSTSVAINPGRAASSRRPTPRLLLPATIPILIAIRSTNRVSPGPAKVLPATRSMDGCRSIT